MVTRVIRAGECAQAERDADVSTPESRMEALWDLTLMCLAWRREPVGLREHLLARRWWAHRAAGRGLRGGARGNPGWCRQER